LCVGRVVDALKKEPWISDVIIDESTKPVTLRVRFERSAGGPTRIGRVVKNALESDPNNTASVELKYASAK